ncbi:MAG: hypothetical protein QOE54_3510 [Streptosporangiaceae bacterium]|jgi:hypothetical protein|nr:nucleotidyltransferase [Streptosporangiaceae bacterium]MDX6431144.1 hypothetical protein [Streptosporangiaceae bacterium]
MSRVFGDPVDVFTTDDGRPIRFVWRDRLYTVRRVLEHWVTTRDWWREQHPEAAEEPSEREFWRVEASPDKEIGVYELRHDAATDSWMLSRVWD